MSKDVALVTNDPENSNPHVTMKAMVVEEFVVHPYSLNFSQLEVGKEYRRWLKVSNKSAHAIKIKDIKLRPEKVLRLEGPASFNLAPGEERKVYLLLRTDEPVGRLYGLVVFETDLEYLSTKTVRVVAAVTKVAPASPPVESELSR